jgi:hypothetical protein
MNFAASEESITIYTTGLVGMCCQLVRLSEPTKVGNHSGCLMQIAMIVDSSETTTRFNSGISRAGSVTSKQS